MSNSVHFSDLHISKSFMYVLSVSLSIIGLVGYYMSHDYNVEISALKVEHHTDISDLKRKHSKEIKDRDDEIKKLKEMVDYSSSGNVGNLNEYKSQLNRCIENNSLINGQLTSCRADLIKTNLGYNNSESSLNDCNRNLKTCDRASEKVELDKSRCEQNLVKSESKLNNCNASLNDAENKMLTLEGKLSSRQNEKLKPSGYNVVDTEFSDYVVKIYFAKTLSDKAYRIKEKLRRNDISTEIEELTRHLDRKNTIAYDTHQFAGGDFKDEMYQQALKLSQVIGSKFLIEETQNTGNQITIYVRQ